MSLVVVGEANCGKTTLLKSVCKNLSVQDIPDSFENYPVQIDQNGYTVTLNLWDAVNADDAKKFGPRACAGADISIVCFSIEEQKSFEKVKSEWIPDIQQLNSHIRFILVGCKKDKRQKRALSNNNMDLVCTKDGADLAEQTGALKYLECSSLTNEGIQEVIDAVVMATTDCHTVRPKRTPCVIS